VVTLIATALLPEGGRRKVAREFEEVTAEPVPERMVASAPRRADAPSTVR
jgi:hypothetical protein